MKKINISNNQLITIIVFLLILITMLLSKISISLNLTNSLPQRLFISHPYINQIELGDHITFKKNNKFYDQKYLFTKIVVGIKGDKIEVKDDKLILLRNNEIVKELKLKKYALNKERVHPNQEKIVNKDQYFVFGTHQDSLDSRYQEIGLINKNDILYKAIVIDSLIIISFIALFLALFFILKFLLLKQKPKILIKLILILIILTLAASFSANAKDFGTQGEIFEIAETDLSEHIKKRLKYLEESKELSKLQKKWQENSVKYVNRPKTSIEIKKNKKHKVIYFDPSITVKNDIKDHLGNMIAKKGTKVNPLNYKSLSTNLIFIDGDDISQVEWALTKVKINNSINHNIILVRGNIIDLMKKYQIRLYFDQNSFLTKIFNISSFPAYVEQENKLLKITQEVLL